jgi:hypothetical protein
MSQKRQLQDITDLSVNTFESSQKRSKTEYVLPFFKETYVKSETDYLARGPQIDRDANDFINMLVKAFKAVSWDDISNLSSHKYFNIHNLEGVHSHYSRKSLLCVAFTSVKTIEHLQNMYKILTQIQWSNEYIKGINFMPSNESITLDKRDFLEKYASGSGDLHDSLLSFISSTKQLWIKNSNLIQPIIDFLENRIGYTFLHTSVETIARDTLFYSYGLCIRTGTKKVPKEPIIKFNWKLFFNNPAIITELQNVGEINPDFFEEYLEILNKLNLGHPTVSSCYSSMSNLKILCEKFSELTFNDIDYNGDNILHRKLNYTFTNHKLTFNNNFEKIKQINEITDLIKDYKVSITVINNESKTPFDYVKNRVFANNMVNNLYNGLLYQNYTYDLISREKTVSCMTLRDVNSRQTTQIIDSNYTNINNIISYSKVILKLCSVCISKSSTFCEISYHMFENFCYELISLLLWKSCFNQNNSLHLEETINKQHADKIYDEFSEINKYIHTILLRILSSSDPKIEQTLIKYSEYNNVIVKLDLYANFISQIKSLVNMFTTRKIDFTFKFAPTTREWLANTLARDISIRIHTEVSKRSHEQNIPINTVVIQIPNISYKTYAFVNTLSDVKTKLSILLYPTLKCLAIGICNPRMKLWIHNETIIHRDIKGIDKHIFKSQEERDKFFKSIVESNVQHTDNYLMRKSFAHKVVNCRELFEHILKFLF